MIVEALRTELQMRRPFRLRTTDGMTVTVPGPDLALLSPTGKTLIVFHEGESYQVLDVRLISAIEASGPKADGN
jgi:hypothetical protein